jgi:hypothetical protein
VKVHPTICAIEISLVGNALPSRLEGWQPFYNAIIQNSSFKNAYASISSIDYIEESVASTAGTSYKQKVTFKFPATDQYRSERIALFHKTKFVKITLSSGTVLLVGRNDISQNALPVVKSKSNTHLCEIDIETQSIFPVGFSLRTSNFGLPVFLPLNLNP